MKWLIDAGHGGYDVNGYHQTFPAQNKFKVYDKFTAYEGVVVRKVATLIMAGLLEIDVEFERIHEPFEDSPVAKRIQLVNDIVSRDKNCILISLHAESIESDGFETYGHQAELFGEFLAKAAPSFGSFRVNVQPDDKAYVKQVRCKSVVINLLSVYKLTQAESLSNGLFLEQLATAIINVIKQIETESL